MLHLYFGAFDVFLYLGGIYFAIALANAFCDQMDEAELSQDVNQAAANGDAATVAPIQQIPSHLTAPTAKRQDVGVKVAAR
ncbi:hypothetical protein [Nodosilinea sp. P-1105]|uniref:hypothetical protein n=1 Tax=Nodosilinea sp. P-1105 TaxID=2546229 RepID=UPI00146BE779|nr:hypothetical protein [Nodosilinea sp. P-1105]NMF84929.1 hypothetical protein [Nodosilinea sp. P-1105]